MGAEGGGALSAGGGGGLQQQEAEGGQVLGARESSGRGCHAPGERVGLSCGGKSQAHHVQEQYAACNSLIPTPGVS